MNDKSYCNAAHIHYPTEVGLCPLVLAKNICKTTSICWSRPRKTCFPLLSSESPRPKEAWLAEPVEVRPETATSPCRQTLLSPNLPFVIKLNCRVFAIPGNSLRPWELQLRGSHGPAAKAQCNAEIQWMRRSTFSIWWRMRVGRWGMGGIREWEREEMTVNKRVVFTVAK